MLLAIIGIIFIMLGIGIDIALAAISIRCGSKILKFIAIFLAILIAFVLIAMSFVALIAAILFI